MEKIADFDCPQLYILEHFTLPPRRFSDSKWTPSGLLGLLVVYSESELIFGPLKMAGNAPDQPTKQL